MYNVNVTLNYIEHVKIVEEQFCPIFAQLLPVPTVLPIVRNALEIISCLLSTRVTGPNVQPPANVDEKVLIAITLLQTL